MKLGRYRSTLHRIWSCVRDFVSEESGLATVEWAALAGAVLIGAIALGYVLLNSTQTPANVVGSRLQQCESSAPLSSGATANCQ